MNQTLIDLIKNLRLQLLILKLQLQILLLRKRLTVPNLSGPKHIDLHHAGGDYGFAQVNNYHKQWRLRDGTIVKGKKSSLGYYCGYQYFIEHLGKLYQARRDNEEGAHMVEAARPGYWNKNSIGICLQGNFETKQPTKEQLATLKKLLDEKRAEYGIGKYNIYGHRDYVSTLCPGRNLYAWLQKYKKV